MNDELMPTSVKLKPFLEAVLNIMLLYMNVTGAFLKRTTQNGLDIHVP